MRIGVFSDSHGDTQALDELLDKMGYLDAICFLGDIARDAFHLKDRADAMPNHPPFYAVRGNNDYASTLPWDLIIELGGARIYMTHGHRVVSPLSLADRARENGAQIALFGHTHEPMCERTQEVMLLNPGSAGNYCRGGRARACLLEIKGDRYLVTSVTV